MKYKKTKLKEGKYQYRGYLLYKGYYETWKARKENTVLASPLLHLLCKLIDEKED